MVFLEPTVESIQVLSILTSSLHTMCTIDLTQDVDDSDIEDMEITVDETVTMQDFLILFNNHDRVKKILTYFYQNSDNEQILQALTSLCHNLLLVYQDSIHKYM